ncbi:hypothetical protein [Pseudomonas batumici]|uniref:Uncharacterized protein n=1 Tax=Pseudomonas batumici TaxID=226910 RepID=A0A0C2IH77_9PSED|nr:hypothetical protein [Pseudomonas batumici]KIH84242.1 hypothetical protein UCMB321_2042 [Pseudomonas batumici]
MQAQHPSGSSTEATTNTFKIGDDVSYVIGRSTERSVSFSVREGKIVKIDGNIAVVKSRNGRCITQPLGKLTRKGERNALTRALLGDVQ